MRSERGKICRMIRQKDRKSIDSRLFSRKKARRYGSLFPRKTVESVYSGKRRILMLRAWGSGFLVRRFPRKPRFIQRFLKKKSRRCFGGKFLSLIVDLFEIRIDRVLVGGEEGGDRGVAGAELCREGVCIADAYIVYFREVRSRGLEDYAEHLD